MWGAGRWPTLTVVLEGICSAGWSALSSLLDCSRTHIDLWCSVRGERCEKRVEELRRSGKLEVMSSRTSFLFFLAVVLKGSSTNQNIIVRTGTSDVLQNARIQEFGDPCLRRASADFRSRACSLTACTLA